MLVLKASMEKVFFDSKEIDKYLTKAEKKVHSKIGAFIMRAARSSMRNAKPDAPPSAPGTPLKSRKGYIKRGRYGVLFGLDLATHSVVVGPSIFPGLKQRASGTNVEVAEKGGSITFREGQKRDGTWSIRAAAWAKANGAPVRERTASYQARPFMVPALKKEIPKLAELWRNAI